MRDLELRHVAASVELRSDGENPGVLVGYAAKYDTISQDLGGFVETVSRSAFTKSLADQNRIVARFNHDASGLLGTTDAGTLTVRSDDVGLRYEVALPNTSVGRDVGVLAARGDLRYSSFAFHTIEDSWGATERGFPLRTLQSALLVDVAPVTSPAYMDTTVAMRSLSDRTGCAVTDLRGMNVEQLRGLILEPTQNDQDDEQRDTHSTIRVSVQRLALDLVARR